MCNSVEKESSLSAVVERYLTIHPFWYIVLIMVSLILVFFNCQLFSDIGIGILGSTFVSLMVDFGSTIRENNKAKINNSIEILKFRKKINIVSTELDVCVKEVLEPETITPSMDYSHYFFVDLFKESDEAGEAPACDLNYYLFLCNRLIESCHDIKNQAYELDAFLESHGNHDYHPILNYIIKTINKIEREYEFHINIEFKSRIYSSKNLADYFTELFRFLAEFEVCSERLR